MITRLRNVKPHSWVLTGVGVRESNIQGLGVFTSVDIPQDAVVVIWGGLVVTAEQFNSGLGLPHSNVGVDENTFLVTPCGEDLGVDDYMNHSCDPSLWLTDQITLVTRRSIQAGEELTFDYAIELCDNQYVMKHPCNCGASDCRKRITGLDWQLPSVQKANACHFSPFIQRRIDLQKMDSK
jgi:hypothetical protein